MRKARHRASRGAPSPPGPTAEVAGRPERPGRPGHEFVGWIALGLIVAVVLTFLARAPATPSRRPPTAAPRATAERAAGDAAALPGPDRRRQLTDDRQFAGRGDRRERGPHSQTTPGARKTTSTSRSTSAAPTTTTPILPTTSPAARPATQGPAVLAGTLDYPNNLAVTVPFRSASGVAGMLVSWRGSERLTATLACPGNTTSGSGLHTISLAVTGRAGGCNVTISLDSNSTAPIGYHLTVYSPGR